MLGNRIKEARKSKNIAQKDLAGALGVTKSAMSLWEKGTREPDVSTLRRIADILDVSADYLIGRSDEEKIDGIDAGSRMIMQQASPGITESEREILALFRRLTDIQRGELIGRAKVMAEQNAAEQAACVADENAS